MSEKQALDDLRQAIDDTDASLLALVNKRISLAKKVGDVKEQHLSEPEEKAIYYRPEREAQVIRQLQDKNDGRIQNNQIESLFREVMSICRGAETRLKVAALGPRGTFTEQAARQQFGSSVDVVLEHTIDDVFKAVESAKADYAVVPVENSTEGGVSVTLDRLVSSSVFICGEVLLPIHQNLLTSEKSLDTITQLYSHGQSLAQCRHWIETKLPQAEVIAVGSNAQAAQMAANTKGAAAIAGLLASEYYDVPCLFANIEDDSSNTTRFVVLSRQTVSASGSDKTSLVISTDNHAGSLFHLLNPLHQHNVSMTRIESRPSKTKQWAYFFFIDIDGHLTEEPVATAVREIEAQSSYFKWLGSYPSASSVGV